MKKENLKLYIDMGKWNYVITYGIRFAFFMFVGMWFIIKFIFQEEFHVGLHIILWGVGGLVVGLGGWSYINKKFKAKKYDINTGIKRKKTKEESKMKNEIRRLKRYGGHDIAE